jgi:hypothetical protein
MIIDSLRDRKKAGEERKALHTEEMLNYALRLRRFNERPRMGNTKNAKGNVEEKPHIKTQRKGATGGFALARC